MHWHQTKLDTHGKTAYIPIKFCFENKVDYYTLTKKTGLRNNENMPQFLSEVASGNINRRNALPPKGWKKKY